MSAAVSHYWPVDRTATAPAAAPPRVLLVVDDPQRQALLQTSVQRHLPGCRLEVVDSYYDAMARATRLQTDLLVLDLSLDSVLVPALMRFLARAAPRARVHVFDDSLDSPDSAALADTDGNRPSLEQLKRALLALDQRSTSTH